MSKATADLMQDHEAILSALRILERMIAPDRVARTDIRDVHALIGFLKEFADKCHHGKEEELLFPALAMAGVPERDGPIEIMLSDHSRGRKLIGEMEVALTSKPDLARFTWSAQEYVSLLRNHIQKENERLFPLADQLLTEDQLETLYTGFEEHEEKVIGPGRHEELQALLESLDAKYPA
jgi:hemerythrin-like domain-containing protein